MNIYQTPTAMDSMGDFCVAHHLLLTGTLLGSCFCTCSIGDGTVSLRDREQQGHMGLQVELVL